MRMRAGYLLHGIIFMLFIGLVVGALLLRGGASAPDASEKSVDVQPDVTEEPGDPSSDVEPRPSDPYAGDSARDAVDRLLSTILPLEVEESGRTIEFDTDTVPQSPRTAYAALPYEVQIGETSSLVETTMTLRQGETPERFVGRFLSQHIPGERDLARYDDDMYTVSVSFYELDESLVAEYPSGDEVAPAQAGVSAYVRRMNLPDDAVGGREDRFDFIRANGGWILVWLGERTYCRRPDEEFWQPADQLCP